jgi:RNA polymerase sigma factor (sigma-70 family)
LGSVAAETGEAQLYERHSDLVYRYCLRMLGTREDAEDAAQTTFFQALRAMRRGVVPTFEQAWLLTIAQNECKSRYRAGSRRRRLELAHDPQSLEELAEAPNGGDGRLVGVQQALSRLPETQRRALLLREWQGRSYAEIAHELGVSRPAVEALIFRARRGLAHELGEETKTRRHAFDLASLLGALKTLLGGGAAVKVAVGVAAVATVGGVVGGSAQGPAPIPMIRKDAAVVARLASTPLRTGAVVVEAPSRLKQRAAKSGTVAKRKSLTRRAKPVSSGVAPAAPRVEQSSPQPATGQAPTAPPVQAPSPPAVPAVPEAPNVPLPPPPPLPTGQLPQLPAVPALPALPQVPQLPQVPDLPQVPELPVLPEVPALPDIPILP